MANLIIKPTSGGSLVLQDEGGDAALTVGTTGSTTLAGTANNLGTSTAGTLSSGVTFPTGHVLNTYFLQDASGTSYDLNEAYSNNSITNNTHYDTGMYFKLTPASSTNKFIIQFQMVVTFHNTSSDGGYSLILGVTPTGGSETKPITCQDRTSLSGNEHGGFYEASNYHSGAHVNSISRNWFYTCSSSAEHLFKLYFAGYSANEVALNNYGNTKPVWIIKELSLIHI